MQKMRNAQVFVALPILFTGAFLLHGTLFGKATADVERATARKSIPAEAAVEAEGKAAKVDPAVSAEQRAALLDEYQTSMQKLQPLPPELVDGETLWLARGIYSETKRPEEQELVGWVIRNRVETRYRGKRSYEAVVLDPYQFSAFNPGDRKRQYYSALTANSKAPGWQRALTIAHRVRHAPPAVRPFPRQTRHFYSERSMVGRQHPTWAHGLQPVTPQRDFKVEPRRFRFFAGIS